MTRYIPRIPYFTHAHIYFVRLYLVYTRKTLGVCEKLVVYVLFLYTISQVRRKGVPLNTVAERRVARRSSALKTAVSPAWVFPKQAATHERRRRYGPEWLDGRSRTVFPATGRISRYRATGWRRRPSGTVRARGPALAAIDPSHRPADRRRRCRHRVVAGPATGCSVVGPRSSWPRPKIRVKRTPFPRDNGPVGELADYGGLSIAQRP